jgi:hypothetical protein
MTTSSLEEEIFSGSQKRKGWFYLVRRDGDRLKISVTEPRGAWTSIEGLDSKVHGLIYKNGKLVAEFERGGKTMSYSYGTLTLIKDLPEELGSNLIEVACEAINKFLALER